MNTNHSPLPWTLLDDTTFSTLGDKRIVAANRISPGIVFGGLGAETDANAAFIVKAVNNHEALVEAATELLQIVRSVRGLPEEDEQCDELCGNAWCHDFGCVSMKLRQAAAALQSASGSPEDAK